MSTIIFSDCHFSSYDSYGLKTFREKALRQVLEAGTKADMIIQAGDDLNQRYFDAEIMAWMSNIYTESLGKDIEKLWYILGNHDGSNRQVSPFTTFANGAKCYGRGPTVVGNQVVTRGLITMRGWLSNEPFQHQEGQKYLVSHARVKEWVFNTPEKAFSKTELESTGFKRIFLGDCHQVKDEGRLVSIGSLCPHSFADKDVVAGFIVFDTDCNQYQRIKISGYPIFRVIEIYEDVELDLRPEYIKNNIIKPKLIGSHKFMQDKIAQQRWKTELWSMQPHYVADFDFQQTASEIVVPTQEIPIEEEIKQAAKEQDWPEGADNVAINEMTR